MTGFEIVRCLPTGFLDESLRADALAGLTRSPKQLPPKWFYDERGTELFERITQLPEYYPTRAEREILRARATAIAAVAGTHTLGELGASAADKTRLLLDALRERGTLRRYVPVDVSEAALQAAGRRVLSAYPGLDVHAVVSDFEEHLGLSIAPSPQTGPRMVAFLGSTIGNLLPAERAEFLASLRSGLAPADALLLGTDLVKDPAVLVAAYDDDAGVTAAFNKNVLTVLNRELVAVWDSRAEWIEMRLRSRIEQIVKVPALDLAVPFVAGEEMRTEVSAKFRREGVRAELAAAGFGMRCWWTDAEQRFALSLSVPV